jgi:hypothetical protein
MVAVFFPVNTIEEGDCVQFEDFWVILEYFRWFWWVYGVLEVFFDENELKNLNPTSLFFLSPQWWLETVFLPSRRCYICYNGWQVVCYLKKKINCLRRASLSWARVFKLICLALCFVLFFALYFLSFEFFSQFIYSILSFYWLFFIFITWIAGLAGPLGLAWLFLFLFPFKFLFKSTKLTRSEWDNFSFDLIWNSS